MKEGIEQAVLEMIRKSGVVKWSTKTGHRVRVFPVSVF